MAKYNGHKSWNAWNVSLWINNDEGLYNLALALVREHGRKKAARIMAQEFDGKRTPDGATYNNTNIYAAMAGME